MRIDLKNHDLSKTEEIAIIEKLHTFFKGSDVYLAALFTDEFLGWVSQQIKNDFPPDLYGWGVGDGSSLRAEVEDLKNTNEDLKKTNKALTETLNARSDVIDGLDERIGNLIEQKGELEGIIDKKAEAIDALEMEVIALKAKLYDLMPKRD